MPFLTPTTLQSGLSAFYVALAELRLALERFLQLDALPLYSVDWVLFTWHQH
uniref:Uncharacterized protein n=1 Tax=Octopus bimaculoides TaxID=37653 RepID=A0A0L8FIF0_OCTBM